ncbi:hypothetical protein MHH33_06185 [Paenisporosarcina sp. FSL H8-0542]|uniref:YncE family protein n=1 Tax=Paenisporosarcina sp. FSL H8-0542 TaxID=2921401 RepID=UPI00315AADE4
MFQMNIIKKLKTSFEIKMSNDQGLLCHTMGGKTIVFDTKSWEKVAELTKPKHPGDLVFSRNNDYLYIKNALGTLCVYDTTTFQLVKNIQSNKSLKMTEGRFAITKDPFKIIDMVKTKNGNQLASINLDNADSKVITTYEDTITRFTYHQYIPSEDYHLFTLEYDNKAEDIREYKLLKIKESTHEISLLSHPNRLYWKYVIYDPIHDVYIVMQENYKLIVVDSTFKKVLREKTLYTEIKGRRPGMYVTYFHQSSTGKYIVVTYDEMILILRYEDLEVLMTETIQYACFAEFSDDNQYLLIGTWKNGYVLENNLQ